MAKRMLIDNEQVNENGQTTIEQSSVSSPSVKEQLTVENKAMKETPEDRYAHMFADWDLLPPQVLIRRVSRK